MDTRRVAMCVPTGVSLRKLCSKVSSTQSCDRETGLNAAVARQPRDVRNSTGASDRSAPHVTEDTHTSPARTHRSCPRLHSPHTRSQKLINSLKTQPDATALINISRFPADTNLYSTQTRYRYQLLSQSIVINPERFMQT
ncbi:jg1045 [Pararge aegeria aegeria]|uniref:Jg1045 protein n=1 Tax=Pararge aegeria aegeria TaxID=348720 RepID=A0A8S4R3S9_9NEOP|nr:jg1045 [Pararge aegeria aegeria]